MRRPRAIAPFIDDPAVFDEEAQEIVNAAHEAKRTEDELRALEALAGDDPGEVELTTLLGKIAALSVFEKSKWGRTQWVNILQEALSSAEMSYYFASATNPSTAAWKSLAESMAQSPRFSFAALKLEHLPITAFLLPAREMLKRSVKQNDILNWALEFSYTGRDKRTLSEDVIGASDPSSEACALALALAPRHSRVQEWIAGLKNQPQLAYETRRLLSLTNQLDAEFLLASKLGPIAMSDPLWAFHWLRDFSEGDVESAISLVPHLAWLAELIDSGVCPVEHASVIDARAAQTMDFDHWLRSGFLLFSANKATANE